MPMKKYLYALMFLLITGVSLMAQTVKKNTPAGIIFFDGSLPAFEILLQDSGKPGFVFLYSAGQRESAAIKRLLEDESVINYVDSAYHAYKTDVTENPQLALKYGIENVPCLIIIDKNLRERSRIYGYRTPADFINLLKQVFE